jgi:hypothetical protein
VDGTRDRVTYQNLVNVSKVGNVTLHVHTCSGRNRIIPLMRRPNTDSTPNKPVTLPRNQLLIRYAGTSLVHTVTIRCFLCLFSTTHCSILRLIVRSGLDVATFATRRLQACHHVSAPSDGRWNCGRGMSGNFA